MFDDGIVNLAGLVGPVRPPPQRGATEFLHIYSGDGELVKQTVDVRGANKVVAMDWWVVIFTVLTAMSALTIGLVICLSCFFPSLGDFRHGRSGKSTQAVEISKG